MYIYLFEIARTSFCGSKQAWFLSVESWSSHSCRADSEAETRGRLFTLSSCLAGTVTTATSGMKSTPLKCVGGSGGSPSPEVSGQHETLHVTCRALMLETPCSVKQTPAAANDKLSASAWYSRMKEFGRPGVNCIFYWCFKRKGVNFSNR